MHVLVERIRSEGRNLGGGILKVNGFINHQLDPVLTMAIGREFVWRFQALGVTGINKVVTAEVSGIAPGFATGVALNVPIVFARKSRPITLDGRMYRRQAVSRTQGGIVELNIAAEYLSATDRVLVIDDFLARGATPRALCELVVESGATLCGFGAVIEKKFEQGRDALLEFGVPLVSLAIIESLEGEEIVVRSGED